MLNITFTHVFVDVRQITITRKCLVIIRHRVYNYCLRHIRCYAQTMIPLDHRGFIYSMCVLDQRRLLTQNLHCAGQKVDE